MPRVLSMNYGAGAIHNDSAIPNVPKTVIQSVTMAVRIGNGQYAIGYVHEFNFKMDRDAKPVYQIEPYPNGTFAAGLLDYDSVSNFLDSTYWPSEVIEVIPGKVGPVTLTLNRYALYSSNLLASTLRIENAGTESGVDGEPEEFAGDINLNGTVANRYVSLVQQIRPIDIHQIYISPKTGKPIFGRTFQECWFTSLGETIPTSEENGPILENGELMVTRVRPFPIEL